MQDKLKNRVRRRLGNARAKARFASLAFGKLPFSGFLSYLRASLPSPSGARPRRIAIPGGLHVRLRDNQTDLKIFEQIFLLDDCGFALPGFRPKLIIDGGAHVGCATLAFALRFPEAKIIAVEAHAGNFRQLCRNVESLPNVTAVHAAVFGSDGRQAALSNPDDDGWGFRFHDASPESGEDASTVDTVSVGRLIRESGFDRCDLLKLDIEGAERDVFRTLPPWLESVKVLVIELHDRYQPGCTEALNEAVSRCSFRHERTTFNHVYINSAS